MFWFKFEGLCKKRGVSASGVCRKLGFSSSLVTSWKNKGTHPQAEKIKKLAEYFGVDVSYFDEPEEKAKSAPIAVRIPVFARVPAGIPLEAIEDIVDYEEIPAAMLNGERVYFGVIVRGDSMYPKYIDGDIVIVRKQETFENGQDCIVYVNGYEATLKTVYQLSDGIRLQPINTSYMPKTYPPDGVVVAGVVVEIRRKV